MLKTLIGVGCVIGLLAACGTTHFPLNQKQNMAEQAIRDETKNLTPEQKALLKKEKQALLETQKAKCQDAKMNLVEAEGNKDLNGVNVANKRIRQYCQSY